MHRRIARFWESSVRVPQRALRVATFVAIAFAQTAILPAGHFVAPARANGTISVVGQLTLPEPGHSESDIWGWVDPNTNKPYAVVGQYPTKDVFIIDCSDPGNPVLVSTIKNMPGFDVKYWNGYIYGVNGSGSGNGKIYDVSDPTNPDSVGTFLSSHNVTIAGGYMYNSINGLKIYDLHPDPTVPSFLFYDNTANGHDVTVHGNRLFDFHGYSYYVRIYDVTNPGAPVLEGTITDPNFKYPHSGDTDVSGDYLYMNDELATSPNADFSVWDISNPALPVRGVSINDPNATIHNSYRVGNFLYVSYYVAGFKVFDITDPANPVLCDTYDTSAYTGESNYNGAWGVYPFAPDGLIYVSDMQSGLWIFRFDPTPTGIADNPPEREDVTLAQNYPNPFNPTTTISYELAAPGAVTLRIYTPLGERVRTLVSDDQSAGPHTALWDGRDDGGHAVASGAYFYRLDAGGVTRTRRMVLLK